MATDAPPTASISSSAEETQVPTPIKTRHEDFDYFDKEGLAALSTKLSRTASRFSTTTQDPESDEFDYTKALIHTFRKQEKNGVIQRELGVTFEGLAVQGDGSGIAYGPSMGEILTGVTRIASAIKSMRNPTKKDILVDFTGTVRPKEMLLVLGRPGSGCSSLLKVLSNNVESFTAIEGNITYDGASPDEMRSQHHGDVVYLPEDDKHLPNLTVRQTLDFAAASRTPSASARAGTREETARETRDILVTLFGLLMRSTLVLDQTWSVESVEVNGNELEFAKS